MKFVIFLGLFSSVRTSQNYQTLVRCQQVITLIFFFNLGTMNHLELSTQAFMYFSFNSLIANSNKFHNTRLDSINEIPAEWKIFEIIRLQSRWLKIQYWIA